MGNNWIDDMDNDSRDSDRECRENARRYDDKAEEKARKYDEEVERNFKIPNQN